MIRESEVQWSNLVPQYFQMTDEALKTLILGDPEAKALADSGDDGGCATRVNVIGPTVPRETRHTFLSLAAHVGPAVTERLIRSIRAAVAGGNLLLDEVQWSLRNAPGVDVAHPATHGTLDALVAAAVPNGLVQADAEGIEALGDFPDTVYAGDISRVYSIFRPEGKVA